MDVSSHRLWVVLRAFLAGTVIMLAPLLLLEDLDFVLGELHLSVKFWPDWSSIPVSLAGGAATATWAAWRGNRDALPRLELLAESLTRYILFLILSLYAISKVLRTQFRVPYVVLDTPLGDVGGYMLAWRFLGYSYGHEIFVAGGELLGPFLLLFRRTSTLGACITAAVLANIVVVNFTHEVPVRRFSSCLLSLTAYLLVLDGRRLLDFFVLNRAVQPRPEPPVALRSPWLYISAKAGWVVLALAYSFVYIALGDSRTTPVAGAWEVDSSHTTEVPWRMVYFERGLKDFYPGAIRREPGAKPERFRYEFDAADRHIRLIFSGPKTSEPDFDGIYEGNNGRLTLRGRLGERAVEIELVRKR